MAIRFTHLRIAGFKSFCDPITLEILPGLTGIIGPNGCGKSNIVEAIRWVMGESSAKSLRGGEMDDVIFAGTTRRSARNIAEVALTLEGTEKIAPAPFQMQDQLQISRQLERGTGSQYKINNKTQRARDIQTFFADLGSGPRSSAIISQNRIAQLISASPEERRQVLEEAAGIAGLYSRRREAELKLKATEENLARLDDLQQQLTTLIDSLNEQSSQATIYRRLSSALRESEKTLQSLYIQRAIRSLHLFKQKKSLAEATQVDTEFCLKERQVELIEIEGKLPHIRQQELQSRTKCDAQRNETRVIKEQQSKIFEQVQQLEFRITEATEQHLATITRTKKTEADLIQINENLQATEKSILDYPVKTKIIQDKISNIENQLVNLNQDIQQQNNLLTKQHQQYQFITQQYEQAQKAYLYTEQEYQKAFNDYQYCLKQLPQKQDIDTLANIEQQYQQQLQEVNDRKQQLDSQLNELKLHANNARYHAQQTEQAYTNLNQEIQKKIQKQEQLNNNQSNLELQLQKLQQQALSQQERLQFNDELILLQKSYHESKEAAEKSAQNHQNAIETHLKAESAFQQATKEYENHQKDLNSTQQAYTQAQKNADHLAEQINKARSALIDTQLLTLKETEFTEQQHQIKILQETIERLSLQYTQAQEVAEQAQKTLYQHEADQQKLQAKRDGLAQALSHDQKNTNNASLPPILESLTIPPEWLVSVAVLFDETLENPASSDAQIGWSTLPPSNAVFPHSIQKLSEIISPPPSLQRAFDHIGIVQNFQEGEIFFKKLSFGQSLVTQNGDLWRWDGYHIKAGLQNKAAQRLLQRETLKQTEHMLAELDQQHPILQTQYQKALSKQQTIKSELIKQQATFKANEPIFKKIQQDFMSLQNRAQAAQTQFEALQPAYKQAQQDFTEKQKLLDQAKKDAALPKPDYSIVTECQNKVYQAKVDTQQAQQSLYNLENEISILKDHQQKRLNQDQQNNIHIETIQDKLLQIESDQEQIIQSLQQDQEQLTQIEQPQQALAAKEIALGNVKMLEQQITEIQNQHQQIEHALLETQKQHQQIKEIFIQQNSQIKILQPRCNELKKNLDKTRQDFNEAEILYTSRPQLDPIQDKLQSLQNAYTICKGQEDQERLAYHLLQSEKDNLIKQKISLEEQSKDWQERLLQNKNEEKSTLKKITQLQTEYNHLNEQLPALDQKITLLTEVETQADQIYQEAQQKLFNLEQSRSLAQKQLQQAQEQASKARENLLKAQAKHEQAEALLEQLRNNIDPNIQEYAIQQSDLDISDIFERKLKATITDHSAERDALGAVNLRAEIEREEKQEQLNSIEKEYNELATAIQQLRDSIQKLNQQGKEKLNAIFTEVNQHFQDLFTRMFNGGSAYLKLLAHEDPLQSGLEIYAQPPGKKLSTLSLLSGGEQALTALSLVFAVSRCNPVPLCILDEVDAPLDDPNVERFCALLSDMTEQAGTRFLVVTHHQLTMSHMNRLYGVTMQERGVSQIISIDLEHAVLIQQEKHVEQLGLI